ncbi:MAG: hypothetical protein JNM19_18505 [Chitinophagaceae bacterium]|nr:hypothetical protein [Chitinophagaceae bacterium]
MKSSVILFACSLPLAIAAQQVQKKVSFYAQGGYRSSNYIKEAAKEHLASATETHHHKCIILNAGFQYRFAAKWRAGLAFTYDHFGTKHRSVELSNISYLIRCDRIWRDERRYLLYSGVMLGITKIRRFEDENETERKTEPGYHLCLIGAEYKIAEWLSIDLNAGWGAAGLLSAGARFKF